MLLERAGEQGEGVGWKRPWLLRCMSFWRRCIGIWMGEVITVFWNRFGEGDVFDVLQAILQEWI